MYCPAHPFATPHAIRKKPIGIVLFNGFALSELSRLVDAFQPADADNTPAVPGNAAPCDVVLFSAAGGRIASANSVFVWTERIEAMPLQGDFHAFFVLSGSGLAAALKDTRLVAWLRRAESSGERVIATASTRQHLRAAGVTTHDATHAAHDLIAAARSMIDDERSDKKTTHQDSPDTYANKPLSDLPAFNSFANDRINASIRWLEAHVDKPMSIRDAAQAAAMSERNYLRRFKAATGFTPSEYVLNLRIKAICQLLVETDLPVEKIARRCGIGSGAGLSKLFRHHFQLTPTDYRRQFAAERERRMRETAPTDRTPLQQIRVMTPALARSELQFAL
ncbi:helix-turn-helix domain-containing protein [Paraburkholderia tropica]|uniref:helix-turn-helix domain-containing protein n=1 Tax=Paraburkholderia tropica TaxID=92647 RepID=UPI002ABD1766|nr:helix-turn-helix domain-containing protein [Paraburkholderia tropica]